MRLTGDTLLFEVPEDTQRRLLAVGHVKPSRLNRILVSAAGPDQLGGLPGEPAALWTALRTHRCRNQCAFIVVQRLNEARNIPALGAECDLACA